jgi:hypothetical protein
MFQKNILGSSSGSKNKARKTPAEEGSSHSLPSAYSVSCFDLEDRGSTVTIRLKGGIKETFPRQQTKVIPF